MRRAALVLCGFLVACAPPTPPGTDPDLASAGDLASPSSDLATSTADMATSTMDMASSSGDMATAANDLSTAMPDLSTGPNDLSTAPNDLSTAMNDLSMALPDLSTAMPDLSTVMPDLSSPPDLTTVTPVAWGQPCDAASACQAPGGETGFCSPIYGTPICVETCDALPDFALCESGNGICVPTGDGSKACLPKCGDEAGVACGAGSSCSFLGVRVVGQNAFRIGACLPDCAATGPDACQAPGRSCDLTRKLCNDTTTCEPFPCPTGSTCTDGRCVPTNAKGLYADCTQPASGSNGCLSEFCAGFCTRVCNTDDEASTCGAGGVCWLDNNRELPNGFGSGDVVGLPNGQFGRTAPRSQGACLKACTRSSDCPAGFSCGVYNGTRVCTPAAPDRGTLPAPGTGLPGQLCRAAGDCASGSCFRRTGYRDGVCMKSSAAACPGGTGAPIAQQPDLCLRACDPNQDDFCGGGLGCGPLTAGSGNVCFPYICRDDADCTAGFFCDAASSECRQQAATGAGIGAACTDDADCASGLCLVENGGEWVGGYCTNWCTNLPDLSDTCPTGAICSNSGGLGNIGLCFDLCDVPAAGQSRFGNCRNVAYVCEPFVGDPRFGVCLSR